MQSAGAITMGVLGFAAGLLLGVFLAVNHFMPVWVYYLFILPGPPVC